MAVNWSRTMLGAAGAGGAAVGSYIMIKNTSGTVYLLDHTTKGSLSLADSYSLGNQIFDFAFTPDGKYIAATSPFGGTTGTTYMFDHTTKGTLSLASTYSSGGGYGCAWTSDGSYLATGFGRSGNPIYLLSHSNGTLSSQDTQSMSGYGSVGSFSPNDSYLTAHGTSSPYFTLLTHSSGNLSSGSTFSTVGEMPIFNQNCTWSPDNNYIAVAQDGSPYFRLLSRSGSSVSSAATLTLARGRAAAFSPDGNYIAFTNDNYNPGVRLIERTNNTTISQVATISTPNAAAALAWSPDGQYIGVTSQSNKFKLIDHTSAGSMSEADTYDFPSGEFGFYARPAFSPD